MKVNNGPKYDYYLKNNRQISESWLVPNLWNLVWNQFQQLVVLIFCYQNSFTDVAHNEKSLKNSMGNLELPSNTIQKPSILWIKIKYHT